MPARKKAAAPAGDAGIASHGAPIAAAIDWAPLYQAADALYALKPWEWMTEDQMFAVQDPKSGELGISSIMGMRGEHLAVALYLGGEGLWGYERMADARDEDDAADAFVSQRSLMLSFEDREALDSEDRGTIKALGLKYRGAMAWPLFRALHPGYLPWHVTPDEAAFLLLAVQQVLEVAPRLRQDEDALGPPQEDQILCRVRREGAWHDRWVRTPEPQAPPHEPPPPLDEAEVALARQRGGARQGVWQVDYTLLAPIFEKGQRPYLARGAVILEAQSGLIIGLDMLGPGAKAAPLSAMVLRTMRKAPALPAKLQVRRPELHDALAPLAAAVGVPLEQHRSLPAVQRALKSLRAQMG